MSLSRDAVSWLLFDSPCLCPILAVVNFSMSCPPANVHLFSNSRRAFWQKNASQNQCAFKSLRNLDKTKVLIQFIWSRVLDCVFITSFQVMVILLRLVGHYEYHGLRALIFNSRMILLPRAIWNPLEIFFFVMPWVEGGEYWYLVVKDQEYY